MEDILSKSKFRKKENGNTKRLQQKRTKTRQVVKTTIMELRNITLVRIQKFEHPIINVSELQPKWYSGRPPRDSARRRGTSLRIWYSVYYHSTPGSYDVLVPKSWAFYIKPLVSYSKNWASRRKYSGFFGLFCENQIVSITHYIPNIWIWSPHGCVNVFKGGSDGVIVWRVRWYLEGI